MNSTHFVWATSVVAIKTTTKYQNGNTEYTECKWLHLQELLIAQEIGKPPAAVLRFTQDKLRGVWGVVRAVENGLRLLC